jgi:hypothetical protein
MSAKNVLTQDWSDYDNRKLNDGRDKSKFSCSELWEINFLVESIRKTQSSHSMKEIRNAISKCCNKPGVSRVRNEFVEEVLKTLAENEIEKNERRKS